MTRPYDGLEKLFKFRPGPPRIRPPQPRPPVILRIETQYEWGERENWARDSRFCPLAIITINDDEAAPAAIVTSLTEDNGDTFVVINSFTGRESVQSWESHLGTKAERSRDPFTRARVLSMTSNPVLIEVATGWLPRQGFVILDLMVETISGPYDFRGPWFGLTIRDLNGEVHFEYYGEGKGDLFTRRRSGLRDALQQMTTENIVCQL